MAASLTQTTILAALAPGNQNLSLIDGDFSQLYGALNSLNNFDNFYADTGSASAYAITVPTVQSYAFAAGLPLAFLAATGATGASTLQITSAATSITKNLVNPDASAISNGQIKAGQLVWVVSDGTSFQCIGLMWAPAGANKVLAGPSSGTATTAATFRSLVAADLPMTPITASLGTDITLGSAGIYFDGPSVAQGTAGTWFASGTVTVQDTAGSAGILARLWDGTTIIASCQDTIASINQNICLSLSGFLASPVGNLRISVRDITSASGKIIWNVTGSSKDSTISAIRIA